MYTAWGHGAALVAVSGCGYLLWQAPETQRLWIAGVSGLVTLAAFITPAPLPILLAGMTLAGIGAVALDRFNPDALRWRSAGGLALYAAAALAYGRYLAGIDAFE
ncbi:hypothetical protein KFU94_50435 [Chloroflexi bacterium TSY]|nr:hypothetical protein [Chloroflexi bacterium TSY]